MSRLLKDGQEPDYPDNPAPDLFALLMDVGPVLYGGMGAEPLSSTELMAYQAGTKTRLTPWEFRLMRTLSAAYLGQLNKSGSPNCPAPWRPAPTAASRAALEKRIRAAMR